MATDSHFARTWRLDLHKPDTVIWIPRNFSPCSVRGLQNTKYSQFYHYACIVKADWLAEEVNAVFIRVNFTHMCCMSRDFSDQITTKFVLILYFFLSGSAAQRRLWPPRSRGFLITHNDAPQSVGLLWTNDKLVADTSTWQHNKQPCPLWDSKIRSQQASGRRPTP
jgi:hypothetical protein